MNLGTQDVGLGISAAGTTQATATELINGLNEVTTVASGAGVVLFSADSGTFQAVYNAGANQLKVYPPVGYKINSLPINTAMILGTGTSCEFWFLSTTKIIGNLSA